ncbi:uroporphyrinogen-III synthase hemD [Candidatus Kinetoplastibacterium desouzaii TCC079E]|uniref:Uroporphyrinogen-III synthase hemD n=1 Tax=Candidatus Kinetoplastidibacterium desouzai TCC079E TaxID=1208919 RepID=M1LM26_9PROT|nr:uroporphyrinogen-III synthase [Candidatus Kinetoplastibacterium desouzaii]AGF46767.1 uroporphyrinogen-III synthase hemD [Candidatus Kinetoplastibacterium desouzaii TCC079E]
MSFPQTVVLTRPENYSLYNKLKNIGIDVYSMPLLLVEPIKSSDIKMPNNYDFVVFVSGNAIKFYLKKIYNNIGMFSWPSSTFVATVGPSSAKTFRCSKYLYNKENIVMLYPDQADSTYDSESLYCFLNNKFFLSGRRFLIVRGLSGRNWLIEKLRENNFVDVCHVYNRKSVFLSSVYLNLIHKWIKQKKNIVWVFTSQEIVSSFFSNLKSIDCIDWLTNCFFLVTHKKIMSALSSQLLSIKVYTQNIRICDPIEDSILDMLANN